MKDSVKIRLLSLLAITMMVLLAGCGNKTAEGQITAIDGSNLTVSLGEVTEQSSDAPSGENGGSPPGDGDSAADDTTASNDNTTTVDGSATGGDDTTANSDDGDDGADGNNQTPPEKPEGDDSGGNNGEAPADNSQGGTPPGASHFTASGDSITIDAAAVTITLSDGSEGTVDDLSVNDIISITYSGNDKVSAITVESADIGGGNDESPGNSESMELTGAYTVDGEEKTISSGTYASENSDENAILVTNGGRLSASGLSVTKTGDSSSADNSNFYGLNGAVVAAGTIVTLSDTDITTDSEGSNAIFSTGDGAAVSVSDTTIHTMGDSSRGLDATYGGAINATRMTITTEGAHCAPVATDRGEGTVTISDSTLNAAGDGSPCIYSTGDITAENVTATATGAQAAVIEGKNSIALNNCNLTGAGENGIMLYQSTSGDAGEGTGVLTSTDSTISTTSDGPMFYITNTDAKIKLSNTTLNFSSGTLLKASGNNTNNWGEEGSNGGDVTLTAKYQALSGDILCDEISSVILNLGYSSTYQGTINGDNSGGSVALHLGKTATVTLTGDSYVSVLTDKDGSLSNIVGNGHTLYYDSDNSANAWLDGKTVILDGGGTVAPV